MGGVNLDGVETGAPRPIGGVGEHRDELPMSAVVISWKLMPAPGCARYPVTPWISSIVRSLSRSPAFIGTSEGTHSGRPAAMSCVATLPACCSWMAILAPCACTRLVRFCSPGRKTSSEIAT